MVDRNKKGQVLKGQVLNPSGKGGFQERPDDINKSGRWNPRASETYCLRKYLAMTPRELAEVKQEMDAGNLTTAEAQALLHVMEGNKATAQGFKTRVDIMDRLDGKARQPLEQQITTVEPPIINIEFK